MKYNISAVANNDIAREKMYYFVLSWVYGILSIWVWGVFEVWSCGWALSWSKTYFNGWLSRQEG